MPSRRTQASPNLRYGGMQCYRSKRPNHQRAIWPTAAKPLSTPRQAAATMIALAAFPILPSMGSRTFYPHPPIAGQATNPPTSKTGWRLISDRKGNFEKSTLRFMMTEEEFKHRLSMRLKSGEVALGTKSASFNAHQPYPPVTNGTIAHSRHKPQKKCELSFTTEGKQEAA